jgi:hypothetical protein
MSEPAAGYVIAPEDVGLKADLQEAEFYTEAEIAEAIGRTKATVNRRARKGRKSRRGAVLEAPWKVHHLAAVQGGREKVYLADDLPADVQAALIRYELGYVPPRVGVRRAAPAEPWALAVRSLLLFASGFVSGGLLWVLYRLVTD